MKKKLEEFKEKYPELNHKDRYVLFGALFCLLVMTLPDSRRLQLNGWALLGVPMFRSLTLIKQAESPENPKNSEQKDEWS
jgi:hypothetical protein